MNSQISLDTLFAALVGLGILGFLLAGLLFKRLESAHAAKYEALGKPSILSSGKANRSWDVFKFLLTRAHRDLNDSYLSALSDGVLVLQVLYVILFFYTSVAIIR